MHLELVELLRCPVPHPATVLVAAADRIVSRYITEGLLGCPECRAEYPIRGGVTYLGGADDAQYGADVTAPTWVSAAPDTPRSDRQDDAVADAEQPDLDNLALRVAAQLAVTEGRTVYALAGHTCTTAVRLRRFVPARVLLVNPPELLAVNDIEQLLITAPAGVIVCREHLPFVPARFDGVAFASAPAATLLVDATRVLRSGGRLVAPAVCVLPPGVRQLACDEQVWVAERDTPIAGPVGITRRA